MDPPTDSLGNHLPFLPDPATQPDYNAQIYAKHEYRVHATRNERQHPIFFNHQRLSQIHMSAHTRNRKLLLYKFAERRLMPLESQKVVTNGSGRI
jgi:hypothetical protein